LTFSLNNKFIIYYTSLAYGKYYNYFGFFISLYICSKTYKLGHTNPTNANKQAKIIDPKLLPIKKPTTPVIKEITIKLIVYPLYSTL
jgi:hypothetical protein